MNLRGLIRECLMPAHPIRTEFVLATQPITPHTVPFPGGPTTDRRRYCDIYYA